MKLSRRGKLARRGKHTKRAGKYLRYKSKSKKIRASKRYHRGNKRTYKRGKRFHRGGDDCKDGGNIDQSKPGQVIDLSTITDANITDANIAFYPNGYKKCSLSNYGMEYGKEKITENSGAYVIQFDNVPLVFTKEGLFTGTKAPGKFKVVIIEQKPIPGNYYDKGLPLRMFIIILTRQDGNTGRYKDGLQLEVNFKIIQSLLSKFKASLENAKTLEKLKSNQDNLYNFYYDENMKYFKLFSTAADVLWEYVEREFETKQRSIKETELQRETASKEEKIKTENTIIGIVTQIKKDGDKFTVTPFMFNRDGQDIIFGDVKTQLKHFAETHKKRIDNTDTIDPNTKVYLKKQIDELLILLLSAQFMYMKILKIIKTVGNDYVYMADWEISNIEKELSTLTEDTKTFIERLGTMQKQDYAYANLQSSLEKLIKRCVIKNIYSPGENRASLDLDKEQKDKLIQEISAPPPATPAVDAPAADTAAPAAASAADTDERMVTSIATSVPSVGDDSLPPRVNT
jgi:hypothetical protein